MSGKNGGTLELLPATPDLSTADGVRKFIASIGDRVNVLTERENNGRVVTEDEWRGVDEALKKLATRVQSVDEVQKAQAALFGGSQDKFTITKAALRLELPDDMTAKQREYFNCAVLRWDELAGISHLGSRAVAMGMAPDVMRGASSAPQFRFAALVEQFHRLNDELLVVDTVMYPQASRGGKADLHARLQRMQQYKGWPEYVRVVNDLCDTLGMERAFNEGSATSGLNWVPSVLSAQMMDLVQVEARVNSLLTQVTMTSKTLDWPVLGSDLVAYLMSEATADGSDTPITASTATTNKVQFSAVKLGVRTFASAEVIEDSIIPMVPFILRNAAKVLARSAEDATVNGEDGTTMDGATFNPAGGVRRAYKGLRYYTLMTGSYPAKVDMGSAAVTVAKLLEVLQTMGAWGVTPASIIWVTGYRGLRSLMKLTELMTLEKFGPNAVILTGQVASILGSAVVLNEYVYDQKTTGVYGDGASRTFGSIIAVHRESWGFATRRGININGSNDRYIETDQTVFVGTYRLDLKPFYTPSATVTPAGILYDIA